MNWIPWLSILVPTATLAMAYRWPSTEYFMACLGGIELTTFGAFIIRKKRNELASLTAIFPSAAGPYLTGIYIRFAWSKDAVLDLRKVLTDGGAELIQIAFFFASMVGMAVYVGQRVLKTDAKAIISYICLVIILGTMVLFNTDFFVRVWLPGDNFLPPITSFFIARYILVCNAILVATLPRSESGQP